MLKAKFELTTNEIEFFLGKANEGSEQPHRFLVEPVPYNSNQTNVVGHAQPIMFLIGAVANGGHDCLLDVSRL
jgi:hypothetical protein